MIGGLRGELLCEYLNPAHSRVTINGNEVQQQLALGIGLQTLKAANHNGSWLPIPDFERSAYGRR